MSNNATPVIRKTVFSPSLWEGKMGYSRGKRVGDHIYIAGCVACDGRGNIMGTDAYQQTIFIIEKIEKYLQELDAGLADVVSTVTHLRDFVFFDDYCRAFKEKFGDIGPVNTTIAVDSMVKPEHLVEITAIAIDSR
ncbi:RidA family protein [Sodalis sp. RH21]|uniref:RidA family protein n=1 Tax=unclassified Sodalis (in: enterobacteria) TaxID=2636512 RepID=UPI0039B4FFA9